MGFFANLFRQPPGPDAPEPSGTGAAPEPTTGFEDALRANIDRMRDALAAAVRASAETMSAYNRAETEHARQRRLSAEWHARAGAGLAAGLEDAARAALARQVECDAAADLLRPDLEAARATSDDLAQRVAAMRARIEAAERNAATLIARRNAVRAQSRVAEALAGLPNGDSAFAALRAFESAVEQGDGPGLAIDAGFAPPGAAAVSEADAAAIERRLAELKSELGR